MYSFIYLGCVPFTTAKLIKGGWFSLFVLSLLTSTPLESMGTFTMFTFREIEREREREREERESFHAQCKKKKKN